MTDTLPRIPSERGTVVAGAIGNVLEWYDFAIYGFFAATIGRQFFPGSSEVDSLIAAFGVFAAGYLMRPIGGLVFGYIGDTHGRKATLVLSTAAMAIPTFAIGLLPTAAQIGTLAPGLLVAFRLLQGLSIGGEYTASLVYLVERAHLGRRGLFGTFSILGGGIGTLAGAATATLISAALPSAAVESWGWRVPFLCGILIGLVGLYLRRQMPDTPNRPRGGEARLEKLAHGLRTEWPAIPKIAGLNVIHAVGFFMLFIYLKTYLQEQVGIPRTEALAITTIGLIALMACTAAFGRLVRPRRPQAGADRERVGDGGARLSAARRDEPAELRDSPGRPACFRRDRGRLCRHGAGDHRRDAARKRSRDRCLARLQPVHGAVRRHHSGGHGLSGQGDPHRSHPGVLPHGGSGGVARGGPRLKGDGEASACLTSRAGVDVQHTRGLSKASTTGSLRVRSWPAINQREKHAIRIFASVVSLARAITAMAGAAQTAERDAKLQQACPSLVIGTYLMALKDESGAFASRSLVTFFADGNLSCVDSCSRPNPSGNSSGTCTGPNTIAATALNFNFDTEPGIVRVDYLAEFDQSKRIEGTMGFSFFDIQGNPLRARSPDVDVVPFTGRFVPVVKIDP